MPKLYDIFINKSSKYCDKWENYLAIYERELHRFVERGEPVSLLEIGVQNGGSLELWTEYLPSDSYVTGIDINHDVVQLAFASPRTRALAFDATNLKAVDAHLGDEVFDIIIDDGSHTSVDIIAAFDIYFDRLKPGGIYIVEDLHCSYIVEYGGGYRRKGTSIEWFKELADVVNCNHIREDEIDKENLYSHRLLMRSVASVSFYDSVCVIEKLKLEKSRPYRRLVSGEEGQVVPLINDLVDKRPGYVFDTVLFGRAALRQANARLLARSETQAAAIQLLEERLSWVLSDAQQQIEALSAEIGKASQNHQAAEENIQTLRAQINELNIRDQEAKARRDEILEGLHQQNATLRSALADKDALIRALNAR